MLAFLALLAATYLATAGAQISEYYWDITWVWASPDGFARPVIGINGQWPCPTIHVEKGGRLIVHINNKLGNETTSIHWHGLFQAGSGTMDGPSGVTQCPIPPGQTFTYDFEVNQIGTYWYHSHNMGQYPDGLRGALVVHDQQAPYAGTIDEEKVLTISDWYHEQMPSQIAYFLSASNEVNSGGAEPIPDIALMNDGQNAVFYVEPSRSYLFHIINIGAFAGSFVSFDGHDMTIVEIDGVYVKPQTTSQIFVTVAQRYSVIIHTKATRERNYGIISSMEESMFDHIPVNLNNNVTGTLVYSSWNPKPTQPVLASYNPITDLTLLPLDGMPLLGPVDKQIVMVADFANIAGGTRGIMNNSTYLGAQVPTLYTALSAPLELVANPTIYGPTVNPYVLPYGAVVEIVLNNHDTGGHPFHLHGHKFQVVGRGAIHAGDYPGSINVPSSATPMRRDTSQVEAGSWTVLRFRADNPGINLFHCHIEWHVEAGLSATFIEAPLQLRASNLIIPQDHLDVCNRQNIPTRGNAVGNTVNWLNLTGLDLLPPLNPMGALYTPPRRRRRFAS